MLILAISSARFAGLQSLLSIDPRAYARGYLLPPLRGSLSTIIKQLRNQNNKTGAKAHPSISPRAGLYSIVDMFVDVRAPFFGCVVLTKPIRVLENPDYVIFDELGIFIVWTAVGIKQSELLIYLLH
jgi:hypothetical protein